MLLIQDWLADLIFTPQGCFWQNNSCIFAPAAELTHGL
jgi:hypothetical protein